MEEGNSASELDFNPLSSCEERLIGAISLSRSFYFNPLSSCEERHILTFLCLAMVISIHSPHARRDLKGLAPVTSGIFQSTLLMRGETSNTSKSFIRFSDFNPLSSCEERRLPLCSFPYLRQISIHSPHARRDSNTTQKYPTYR